MAIAEQFAGLDMGQLIGGPLTAVANASTMLANSTADFINEVGFDQTGKLRTVAFAYQKRSTNEDGTTNLDEMKVEVPMLAIVPIPNIQVDEVNILFDMEVKQSSSSRESSDKSASMSGSARFLCVRVNVSGSVSAHKENTRSSDNSAKYHVDVRATNHGTPEGLARVLDMMSANVAPALVGSTLKDSNGQELQGGAKKKAENLKKLRAEISAIEGRLNAAKSNLDDRMTLLKRSAMSQQNMYQAAVAEMTEADDATQQEINRMISSWSDFQNKAADLVAMVADTTDAESVGSIAAVSSTFGLLALDSSTNKAVAYSSSEAKHGEILGAQNGALSAKINVNTIEKELFAKREEYNTEMAK